MKAIYWDKLQFCVLKDLEKIRNQAETSHKSGVRSALRHNELGETIAAVGFCIRLDGSHQQSDGLLLICEVKRSYLVKELETHSQLHKYG